MAENPMVGIGTLEDKTEFIEKLLERLGHEATDWRTEFMLEWMRGESTRALWNPFATTYKVTKEDQGDPYFFNHNGGNPVKNYASLESGVDATARTMLLSYYTNIMRSLREQKLLNKNAMLKEFKTWSSVNHYHIANLIRQGWTPTGRNIPSTNAADDGPVIGKKQRVVNKNLAKKSARDAGLIVGAGGVTAVIGAISGIEWRPILDAVQQQESFSAILVLLAPALYRIFRAYIGKAPLEE